MWIQYSNAEYHGLKRYLNIPSRRFGWLGPVIQTDENAPK